MCCAGVLEALLKEFFVFCFVHTGFCAPPPSPQKESICASYAPTNAAVPPETALVEEWMDQWLQSDSQDHLLKERSNQITNADH